MNERDKNNLIFIMSLNQSQFEDWYESISDDDADYALELLIEARKEIAMQVASLHDDITDVSDAKTFLKKFTLKGN